MKLAQRAVACHQVQLCSSAPPRPGETLMADKTNAPIVPPRVDPPTGPSLRTLTALTIGVVVVAALYFAQEVLLPVTVAVLLSFVLSPLVNVLRKLYVPHVVAVVFSVAVAIGLIGGIAALVGSQLVEVAADLPRYQSRIEEKVDTIRGATIKRLSGFASGLRGALNQAPQQPTSAPAAEPGDNPAKEKPVPVEVHQPPPDPLTIAQGILRPVLHPLATAAIVFVVAVFILLQRDDLRDRLIRLFGTRDLHRTTLAMDDAAARLSRFFLVQLGINAGFGFVVAVGLYLIGLPSPVLWGIMAGLLRFVPYLGSYVAAAGPVLLAAAVEPGWVKAISVAGLFLVTEPLIGQFLEPLLYGRSTGLSPLSVVISAIFWGWLWGPIGLIISTPITLCLVVVGRHIEQLAFLQVLLGDRPALTKSETFYQRLLGGDTDDLLEQAEEALKETSLSAYYDEVAMPGLELAARDLARGVLTDPQLQRIFETVAALVAEIGSQPDKEAETLTDNATHAGTIRCVGGRSELDFAAASLLAHLLSRKGCRVEVVASPAVSRGNIGNFSPEGVSALGVCYVDFSGAIAPVRFLLRRLRQRLPGARLFMAVWPQDHSLVRDRDLQNGFGVTCVTSLRQAVSLCLSTTGDTPSAKKETGQVIALAKR
jgi:predicted PurR-regulated permease PerM